MKIKPPSRKHILISRRRKQMVHWWLVEEKPKKIGRLSSLNKCNKRLRKSVGKSEFILMAEQIEQREAKLKW